MMATRPRPSGESGQSLVEFALASALFFTILFGIFSFGLAVWRYNFVSDLAQEGARRATVCGENSVLSSSDCDISAYVSARALGLTVTTTTTPSDVSTLGVGDTVSVNVQHNFTPLSALVPGGTMVLQSTVTMIVAR